MCISTCMHMYILSHTLKYMSVCVYACVVVNVNDIFFEFFHKMKMTCFTFNDTCNINIHTRYLCCIYLHILVFATHSYITTCHQTHYTPPPLTTYHLPLATCHTPIALGQRRNHNYGIWIMRKGCAKSTQTNKIKNTEWAKMWKIQKWSTYL